MDDQPLALTIDQTAKRLQVSSTTIRRWVTEGWLPAVKLGGQWRVATSTIDGVLSGRIRVQPERHPKIAK